MAESLNVFINNRQLGILKKDGQGGMKFNYIPEAERCLSLSLPLQKELFNNKNCRGFFNGLLPESEHTRAAIGRKYRINPKNDFSILQAIGYDCAGAVAFIDEKQLPPKEYYEIEYNQLSEKELVKYIKELPQKPLALGVKDMRLSLAGAQDKTAVIFIDNKIGIPKENVPTTHILKPAIEGYYETVENEYLCMKAAQKAGIKVPDVQVRYADDTKYFLIERYDRKISDGKIKRIHQEDFCQAFNIPSAYKYQSEGGVDFKMCFEILRQTTRPAASIKQFIELMIFNYLIGNNDAHGKNFSILHLDSGKIELAPAYDIMCSQVYPELSDKMAMKIGGHYEHDKILPRHFEKFAEDVAISYTQLKKNIKNQCEILPDIFKKTAKSFENTIGKDILSIVEKNCQRMLKNLNF